MNDAWASIDNYLVDRLLGTDPVLAATLAANTAAGLPAIDVSPAQGRMLTLMARMTAARRILEIGTLGGYSTICLARGVARDGRVVTLEIEPRHAAVARANVARAGFAERVEIRVGPALDTLAKMTAADEEPFDLVFIDADKPRNPDYLRAVLSLSRPGTVIVCDNVVRGGGIVDAASADPAIVGIRAMFDLVADDPRLAATAIQTVGEKGHDGFMLAIVQAAH